jgi:hypothetical protein
VWAVFVHFSLPSVEQSRDMEQFTSFKIELTVGTMLYLYSVLVELTILAREENLCS